jgi:Tyrosine phosphatase family
VFHCTTGKDRTGWAAAATLLLLGVSTDDVFADYLPTNDQLHPALQPLLGQFRSIGGDPDLLKPVVGVQKNTWRLPSTRCESGTRRLMATSRRVSGWMPPRSTSSGSG